MAFRNTGKLFLVSVILISIMSISTGCSIFNSEESEPTPIYTPVVVEPLKDIYDSGMPSGAPIEEMWLSPASYTIQNYYPGYTLRCILRVHNGNAVPTSFSVLYTKPENLDEGFSEPPSNSSDWITLSNNYPVIESFGTAEITVSITMPEGLIPADNWMFWLCAKDTSQNTMIQTRLCSKVKVTME